MSSSNGSVYLTRDDIFRNIHWTPTQYRMLKLLADGQPHTREELFSCLDDSLSNRDSIQVHISHMRDKLAILRETIVCELYRSKPHYRHIAILEARTIENKKL